MAFSLTELQLFHARIVPIRKVPVHRPVRKSNRRPKWATVPLSLENPFAVFRAGNFLLTFAYLGLWCRSLRTLLMWLLGCEGVDSFVSSVEID